MLSRQYSLLLTLMLGFLIKGGLLSADEPRVVADQPGIGEGPTANQFYLKIENLIDNVADLDVRRFTILTSAGKTIKFHIGTAGIGTKGHHTSDDNPGVRRLEAIILLRLQRGLEPKGAKIQRLMKFHRTLGSSVESKFDALGRKSLEGIIEIKAKSGRYSLGKPLVVGTVHGEEVIIIVE